MVFQSVYYLNGGEGSRKSKRFYMGFSATLLALITIALACNVFFGQEMWIEHRDVEGGPAAFFAENIAAWYNTLGTAADVTANILGDGLMLYRCHVFWGHSSLAMGFPVLLYLASVAMGITTTIQSGLPGHNLFRGITVNFGIPWIVLTIVFNIIVTAMIAVRLLSMHSKVNRVVGEAMRKKYTGLLAILVESALPFTLLGVCYLATYIREIPESLAFADIWGAFVTISPQAIILRVAMGGAWTRETFNRLESGMEMSVMEGGGRDAHNEVEPDIKSHSSGSHV
ncbi:hypothetical protein DFH08DRAFT_88900 [Mycena albidolilacea]|uniref:Uncharacterized protein n=1 Tax=Mycena albidolilacea TaxID=1033008 RepID=A0AAD7A947_9AGAR|nr:hypothetical protein DFH08DRAFT_88900 [Mycena albidolilacea]